MNKMNRVINDKLEPSSVFLNPNIMKNMYFGCEPLEAQDLQNTQGGSYVANILTLLKGAYFLTKNLTPSVPVAGPLAFGLLTSLTDQLVMDL